MLPGEEVEKHYAYQPRPRGLRYDVTCCDEKALGVLSSEGFLFFSSSLLGKEQLYSLTRVYSQITGERSTATTRQAAELALRILFKDFPPYQETRGKKNSRNHTVIPTTMTQVSSPIPIPKREKPCPVVLKKPSARTAGEKITLLVAPKSVKDMAKQAVEILLTLEDLGGSATLIELCVAMERRVKTRQPMLAIWRHYQKKMLVKGYVSVEKSQ